MKKNFWGKERSYHLARAAFVRKQPRPDHMKSDALLGAVGGDEYCAGARHAATNRYAYAHAGWSRSGTWRRAA
jgi:putative two-component system hydrogenase maturation factor HypX/HoxX